MLLLAALTFGSRALALAVLPCPSGRLQTLLERVPAPLFAGLAAVSLVDAEGSLAAAPVLTATAGALGAAPRRSLPACLLGGLAGYALGALLV